MGIYIKGLNMPEKPWMCPCHSGEYGSCNLNDNISCHEYIPKDCPLVEVPTPHGDLIEADTLFDNIYKLEQKTIEDMKQFQIASTQWQVLNVLLNERTSFKHDIVDAKVIVEREEK